MIVEIGLFILGLALLVKGADFVVDAAARMAKQFGVSDFVIGLTIVAVGTSLPELAASATAAFYGDTHLAVGNVLGSNMANIGLILGLSGVISVITIDKKIHSRDGFLMLLALILFYFFSLDGVISMLEGAFLFWLFCAYILYFVMMKRRFKHEFHFQQYLFEFAGIKKKPFLKEFDSTFSAGLDYYAYKEIFKGIFYELRHLFTVTEETIANQSSAIKYFMKQVFLLSIGIIGVVWGADLLVSSAKAFPIPQIVVGLVFVSVGTSLPELAVALSAIKKNYQNIMVGNIIGSNIANILLVGGLSAVIRPLQLPPASLTLYFPFLLFFTWIFLVFSRNDYKINRIEALTFLLMYAAFVLMLFLPFV